jgi:hypothetical protein
VQTGEDQIIDIGNVIILRKLTVLRLHGFFAKTNFIATRFTQLKPNFIHN